MQLNRVRLTALFVAVLGAVGAIAATAGASPGSPIGATANGGAVFASSDVSGASGATPDAGATSGTGPTGPVGDTGTSGASGSSGPAGTSGATGSSGPAGAPAPAGTGTQTPPPPTTPPTTTSTTPSAPSGSSDSGGHHRHRHHTTTATPAPTTSTPAIVGSQAQPTTATGGSQSSNSSASVATGPTAPPPSLFAGADPLAGVLPGSWSDPFIIDGGADVPQFFVQSFHVPPFLLAIYQAAGAAYDIPWQTLAAINEVETDYGTNLDVSSAGAIGWMQFLPSTWKRYGVDASASGARDPYNAADAIFAAAKYLAAAGGTHNLPAAIFAYNHSRAYVRSVLDRAELLTGEPSALVDSVAQLAEGDFPIQLRYHASYEPTRAAAVATAAGAKAATAGSGGAAPSPSAVGAAAASGVAKSPAAAIYAGSQAAVVAAQDGTVVRIGHSRRLGRFVVVRNAFGDRFTYANLASVSPWELVPKAPAPSAKILSSAVPAALAPGPHPGRTPASAGSQPSGKKKHAPARLFAGARRAAATAVAAVPPATINLTSRLSVSGLVTPLVTIERVARRSTRLRAARREALIMRYFTGVFGLHPDQLELEPLRVGSHVLAGTILGRLARTHGKREPHMLFEIRPAGSSEGLIDPRPFLDAWSQLETLELHRDSFAAAPFYGPNLHPRTVGTLLVTSQVDSERIVLQDTRIGLPSCERTAIAAGNVDRRVLISLEVLVLHGVDPTVSGAWCSSNARVRAAVPAILKTPNAIALTALDGRQAVGSAAAVAIAALAKLPRDERPALSENKLAGSLVLAFDPAREPQALAAAASFTTGFALSAQRWSQLDARLRQIPEPRVPTAVSSAALAVAPRRKSH